MVSFYSHPNKYERLLILVWVFRTSKCNVTKGHQVAGMNHLKKSHSFPHAIVYCRLSCNHTALG